MYTCIWIPICKAFMHEFLLMMRICSRFCLLSPAFSKKSEETWYLAFRSAWRVMHGVWFRVCSRYLVSATPSTVLDWSFWNFTGVLIMVWRFACAFYRILNLFFFSFFHIFNLDFFAWFRVYSGNPVSATPPTVLHRSFWNFTGILIMVWRYACAFHRILK